MSSLSDISALDVYFDSTQSIVIPSLSRSLESSTHIGLRPTQEDRLVLCPRFYREDAAFCGIFDGTVGDDASHYIQQNIIAHLSATPEFSSGELFSVEPTDTESTDLYAKRISSVLKQTFLNADAALIRHCAQNKLHYASSTGVSVFIWKNLLSVAHIGDSKACIARIVDGSVHPEWLTVDHKPNMPHELSRIERSGGSLAWLHGNKPYIRGGDFHRRQANGEHPKQLNYSRAFGGKDLKMFGLIAEPDISHFEITPDDKVVLLGSDGLWDVLNPKAACEIALQARRLKRNASEDLVQWAISEMPNCGVRDNVTVIAIFLNEFE